MADAVKEALPLQGAGAGAVLPSKAARGEWCAARAVAVKVRRGLGAAAVAVEEASPPRAVGVADVLLSEAVDARGLRAAAVAALPGIRQRIRCIAARAGPRP